MIRLILFWIFTGILISMEFKSERQRGIEYQLNAPCCWGGVIAEHDSPIAEQMKQIIMTLTAKSYSQEKVLRSISSTYLKGEIIDQLIPLLHAEMTDDEIIDLFTGIHGSQVRALPKNEGIGWIAWKLPIFVLIISILSAGLIVKKISRKSSRELKPELPENTFISVEREMKKRGI